MCACACMCGCVYVCVCACMFVCVCVYIVLSYCDANCRSHNITTLMCLIYETLFVGQMFKNINISQSLPIKVSVKTGRTPVCGTALMCDVGGKSWNSLLEFEQECSLSLFACLYCLTSVVI